MAQEYLLEYKYLYKFKTTAGKTMGPFLITCIKFNPSMEK